MGDFTGRTGSQTGNVVRTNSAIMEPDYLSSTEQWIENNKWFLRT